MTLENVAVDPPMFMVEPPVESVDRVLDRAAAPVDILFPPRTTSWSTITWLPVEVVLLFCLVGFELFN